MVTSPKGLGSEKDYAGDDQQHLQKTDPSSRQGGGPTKTFLDTDYHSGKHETHKGAIQNFEDGSDT
jgi:hypothetical protein